MLPAEQPLAMELTRTTTLSGMFSSWSVLFSTDSSSSKLRNPFFICQFLSHCKIPALMCSYHSGIKCLYLLGSQDISLLKSFELTIILGGLDCLAKDVPSRAPHVTPDILPKLVSLIDLRNPVDVTFMSPFLCTFFLLAQVSSIPRPFSSENGIFCYHYCVCHIPPFVRCKCMNLCAPLFPPLQIPLPLYSLLSQVMQYQSWNHSHLFPWHASLDRYP